MKQIELQRSVINYLESKKILCLRTKPDILKVSEFGEGFPGSRLAGIADLLAFYDSKRMGIIPVWLEIRSRRGKQTSDKKRFQELVQSKRHVYMTITSVRAAREFFE